MVGFYLEKILMKGCRGSLPGKALSPAWHCVSVLDPYFCGLLLYLWHFPLWECNNSWVRTIVLQKHSEAPWKCSCKNALAEHLGRRTNPPAHMFEARLVPCFSLGCRQRWGASGGHLDCYWWLWVFQNFLWGLGCFQASLAFHNVSPVGVCHSS